jgi:enterochelin esterase family protein
MAVLVALASAAVAPAQPPQDPVRGIVAAFDRHPIVIIGELHGLRPAGDLYVRLVRDAAFQAAVQDIVVEFAGRHSQPTLDRYVAGEDVPAEDVRRIWRDTTKVGSWESPIYAQWLAAIREVNRTLPAGRRLRVLAGDTAIDWTRIHAHAEWAALGDNNVSFADVILREVVAKKHKALVVLGQNHVTRSGDRNGRDNTTTRVEAKAPGSTYVALVAAGDRPALVDLAGDKQADARLELGPRAAMVSAPPLAGSLDPAYLDEVDRRSLIEWGELRMKDLRDAALPDWRAGATSPRLDQLRRSVAGGDAGAVARFWDEVAPHPTTLIEPIAGDPRHVLLTFLYRDARARSGVVVFNELASARDMSDNAMARLPGTDVWFKTYWIRDDMRLDYAFVPDPTPESVAAAARGDTSVVELPAAPPQPWIRPRAGVPAGKLEEQEVDSRILGERRGAWVYTPAGYDPRRATPYPLLMCFDGGLYTQADGVPTPTILDNLIAEGKIPPIIGVFVAQSTRRTVELSNDPRFTDHLTDELLPAVRAKWRATADPALTVACGSSTGGLASAYAAFRHPDVIGNVLSQSGALWPGKTRDDSGREWLTRQIEASPRLPVRFVLQVGVVEIRATPGGGPSILATNRHLRDVLLAKGNELHYTEIAGGHSPLSWRGGLGAGLVELLGKPAAR